MKMDLNKKAFAEPIPTASGGVLRLGRLKLE